MKIFALCFLILFALIIIIVAIWQTAEVLRIWKFRNNLKVGDQVTLYDDDDIYEIAWISDECVFYLNKVFRSKNDSTIHVTIDEIYPI